MPRPIKLRNVDSLPNNCHFGPLDNQFNNPDVIIMTVDEYETIRLIDLEGLNQEECAKQMNVARTTVQGIYNDARKKIAEFLVNGKKLRIEGGEYMAYPDENYTFKSLNGKEEGYYKITHNVTPTFEIIVRDEGSLGELAEFLTELADLCRKKNKVIL